MVFLLAGCFGLGMLLADTCNGLLMHWLVRRSERMAQQAGRVMSAVIACLALAVVAVSHGKSHMAVLEAVWDAYSVWISLGMTAMALLILATCTWYFQSKAGKTEFSKVNSPVAQ
jgi:protein-S-isoprenylcysteine O-methyltransferase Ste14